MCLLERFPWSQNKLRVRSFLRVQIEGSPGTCYSSFWSMLLGFLQGVTTGWERGRGGFGACLAPSCHSVGCSHGAHPVLGVVSAAVNLRGEGTTCKQKSHCSSEMWGWYSAIPLPKITVCKTKTNSPKSGARGWRAGSSRRHKLSIQSIRDTTS